MLSKASIQKLRGYSRKKQRQEEGRLLVEGWRTLQSVLEAGIPLEWLLVAEGGEGASGPPGLVERLVKRALRMDRVPRTQMEQLAHSVTPADLAAVVAWSPLGPDGLLQVLRGPVHRTGSGIESRRLVVVADGLSDPGNLGTIIRTADWFGADAVFAGRGSVEVTNPKVVQSTMGSLFQMPVGVGDSTVEFLESLAAVGFRRISLELDGAADLREVVWPEKVVLVVGNEAHGVAAETSARVDQRVMIPRFGKAESLNAAAAVAVVLGRIVLG
jgi:TrmH family RNA methyltransferase